MKKKTLATGLVGLCFFHALVAAAVAPEPDAERRTVTRDSIRFVDRDRGKTLGLWRWTSFISEAFKVPLSTEWSYVMDDGSTEPTPEISFDIKPGQTLEQVLDNFCAATKGRLRWGRIRGVIWIWPAAGGGTKESLLDVPVTLRLDHASPWESMLALSRAMNEKSPSGRLIQPEAQPREESLPPLEFRSDTSITLNLDQVSAREAASAIMAVSSLRMSAWYYNSDRASNPSPTKPNAWLSIWAHDRNNRPLRHMPPKSEYRAVAHRWYLEAQSVLPKPETAKPSVSPE